jgi:hypothetical protein
MMRKFMFSGVMMSAVVIPYVMSTGGEWLATAKQSVAGLTQSSPKEPAAGENAQTAFNSGATSGHYQGHSLAAGYLPGARQVPVEGYGATNLAEVINFNATPAWVMARWPRVTVGMAETSMQGYRVTLVSGTAQDDIAGSLTYYFDQEQKVALIHFRGSTGDPRKLVALAMTQYQMQPQATGNPSLQLYQVKWNGKPVSELQVQTADVLRADQPYSRFTVELALKRP